MKHVYLFVCFIFLSGLMLAQTPIIFRPGPGLNDGTDEGGANTGKDLYVTDGDNITHGDEGAFTTSPVSNCNNTTVISFFKFDVSTLPAVVDSVVLVFHHYDPAPYCYSNCVADFHFAVVTQPWSETTLQFTSLPTKDPTPFYTMLNHQWNDSLKEKGYNITPTYLDWRNGTIANNGFEIYSSTIGCNNACVYFNGRTSDDTTSGGAYRPYLAIYTPTNGIASYLSKKLGLVCYPNPSSDETNLVFMLDATQRIKFELFDVSERLMYSEDYLLNAGNNKITVGLHKIDAGLYHYRLETKLGIVSGKIIKQ
ncbi:MAG TPA: DNRLRE domain-containing protein [Bacteroidia bacterium]|nr:DNRLRE domain-containing protein [Bacteroidia bacterium]